MHTLLITGGTGSLGNAIVKRLLPNEFPAKIIIYSRDEQKQEAMAEAFHHDERLRFFLGDVRDAGRLAMALRDVDCVIHAAALKIVPKLEYNPQEAVRTNVEGALNLIRAAIDCGVKSVIAVSTDKACQPTNLYGATKLVAEKLFVSANHLSGRGDGTRGDGCKFLVARYGNVAGSRGSVIPLFRRQLEAGQPLTITDPRMTRFWITLPDAAIFVLSSLMVPSTGGEIFLPLMPSFNIANLAEAMAPGRAARIVGIRPGEKLHELMVSPEEGRRAVATSGRIAILPEWRAGAANGGLPEGYFYSSDNAERRLSASELAELLPHV